MEIRAERQGSAVVLNLEGPLTVEADTYRLHELVASLARLDANNVVWGVDHIVWGDNVVWGVSEAGVVGDNGSQAAGGR